MDNTLQQAVIAITQENDPNMLVKLQKFTALLNREPDKNNLQPTPDGKAKSLPISFVEMTLDELFFGQWSLSEPHYQREFNEVIGSAVLTVLHPVSGREIKRLGFASVIITQDKDATLSQFNDTKKKNALDLTFPKLKAEILKNAAASLGKVFGRDINRTHSDQFTPLFKGDVAATLPHVVFEKLLLNVREASDEQFHAIIEIPMADEQRQKIMLERAAGGKYVSQTSQS